VFTVCLLFSCFKIFNASNFFLFLNPRETIIAIVGVDARSRTGDEPGAARRRRPRNY